MLIYLSFLLIIKNLICKDNNNTEDNNDYDIISFNNDFNHMTFSEKSFILYLGTEMGYLKINTSESDYNNPKVTYNDPNCMKFDFRETNESLIIYNNYSVYYLGNKKINFTNGNQTFIFHFVDNNDSSIIDNNGIKTYNIYNSKKNKIQFYLSNVENIFIEYYFLSFILIISGCFSILYGAYHFMFGYIIHLTLFLYFAIFEFLAIYKVNISILASLLSLFFYFIFSISLSLVLRTDKKDNIRYMILKIIHGCSFGYSVFKLLSYYYIFFNLKGINNEDIRRLIYIAFSVIIIGIGAIFNLFNPFKKYIFLPCASVSGSYYITKGLSYVAGGYFSNIIAIREGLTFNYLKNRKEIISTYFIINFLIIILSIYYQIKHIENKQNEMEEFFISDEPIENDESRISNASYASGADKKDVEEELVEKKPIDKEKEEGDEGNEDIEIDDQED